MTRMDWEKARQRDLVRRRGGAGKVEKVAPPAKPKGIKNSQARRLAELQRALGQPYTGSGMTAQDAARLIGRLERVVQPVTVVYRDGSSESADPGALRGKRKR